MRAGLSHRLRGHHLHEESQHISTSSERVKKFHEVIGVESGHVNHLLICSCGTKWLLTLISPLRNEWKWYRQ